MQTIDPAFPGVRGLRPFLDDVYLKELYDGRRPSLGRVFAFYSERDRKGGPALGAGVGGANRAR